jgi:hypothetical protein
MNTPVPGIPLQDQIVRKLLRHSNFGGRIWDKLTVELSEKDRLARHVVKSDSHNEGLWNRGTPVRRRLFLLQAEANLELLCPFHLR